MESTEVSRRAQEYFCDFIFLQNSFNHKEHLYSILNHKEHKDFHKVHKVEDDFYKQSKSERTIASLR
ncbi:hypothetical protein EGI11_03395 [Chryseobacterium sp. H3056]|uniref:Uncharacterized protein n=1 Tax=Kaistella daneshvariae TaxID=2487074 RepID=A0A3N0WXY5_9FLAO|nr:hypothetical protein EGI11_03395 [Kaistella daneshvariae]